jgi:GT2 family glycosyltransferase
MNTTQTASPVNQPLVSIVILYYKRREIIEQTLESALRQDYANREILLIDNNSEDDVKDIVDRLDAGIQLIQLPENMGACGGRNVGIRAAKGNILIFIDDDVTFDSTREVSAVVDTFERKPAIHVLAFQIWDPRTGKARIREWCHTRPLSKYVNQEFETSWYGEGMSAFRREVFDRCGLYYEPLFYGAEGHDMSLRLMDQGFRMLYTPGIRVNHWASENGGRSFARQNYYYTRVFIWMAYKDYPVWAGIQFAIPKVLMMAYFSWRTRTYAAFFRGVWDGVRGLPAIQADRTPVSRDTLRCIAEHERWRPSIWERLARHRVEPQI